jgi:HD superfamily phosphohydrolase
MTTIKDCIHRLINIPTICKQFIDTPEFQRLRHIKQLGLAYLVYPSAVHSRFEHSIGVMHLAGIVIDNLITHGADISIRDKELVQIAGLLHDVGHIAFSHLFDYMLEEKGISVLHEERSIIILRSINTRINVLSEGELIKISYMIKGIIPEMSNKKFLYEIINNKAFGLDVDRLDYLQRDLFHTGMGTFQPDYLISCLRIKNNRLSLLNKGKEDLESLYETRKRLLTLICRHKTVLMIELLIRQGIKLLGYIDNWDKTDWLELDDIKVYYMLRQYCPNIINTIENRKWEKLQNINRFEHITFISKESIEETIKNVNFY